MSTNLLTYLAHKVVAEAEKDYLRALVTRTGVTAAGKAYVKAKAEQLKAETA